MAIVAEVDDAHESELIGVARYAPSDDGTTEVAFVLADAWQGLGLGSLLLEELLSAAEERGIEQFSADELAENRWALRLLARHTTITARTIDSGVVHLVFRRSAAVETRRPSMRVAVLGSGAIGRYYGARLERWVIRTDHTVQPTNGAHRTTWVTRSDPQKRSRFSPGGTRSEPRYRV
jgi:hypothetical protein